MESVSASKNKMPKREMVKIDNKQLRLMEIRRLAVLLLEVVNIAEECVTKLQKGFIEPIDADKVRGKIERMQSDILKIDVDADEALDAEPEVTEVEDPPVAGQRGEVSKAQER